jgi:sugar O-acyltransferase (sialic acid O-acetyltransferase NeuD family)
VSLSPRLLGRKHRRLQPLVIVGAGGFSREAAEAVAASNADEPTWDLLGFVDDDPSLVGTTICGVGVIGPVSLVHSALAGAQVVVCTGRPDNYFSRPKIVHRLGLPPHRYATVVHPSVALASAAVVGHGTVILAGTVITANARIGNHVAIMPSTVITHDDVVADFATLASGVKLGGSVRIGTGAYIGAGALVREGVPIGEWSLVGMGSLVTRPVPAAEQWYGTPARPNGLVAVPDGLLAVGAVSAPALRALVFEEDDGWAEEVAQTRA